MLMSRGSAIAMLGAMWEVMLEVVPDVAGLLLPSRKRRTTERTDPGTLLVPFAVRRSSLQASGSPSSGTATTAPTS